LNINKLSDVTTVTEGKFQDPFKGETRRKNNSLGWTTAL